MREEGHDTNLARRLALWADKLRDLSALGLAFSSTVYDRESYRAVQEIAMALFALSTGEELAAFELLRISLFNRPTPLTTGDAAVIDERGRILLIQRADNQHWAMPGGALEVGETPAEGVAREALEETGVSCEPLALVGLYDSRYRGSQTAHHLYQVVFLCRPSPGAMPAAAPTHGHEVLATGWFPADALPAPLDPGHVIPVAHAFALWRGERVAYFDPLPRHAPPHGGQDGWSWPDPGATPHG